MNRSRIVLWSLMCCLAWMVFGCSHWRDRYFSSGVDDVTQLDVREKFGKPHIVEKSLLEKKTTWIYRIALPESELDPSGLKSFGSGVAELGGAVAAIVGKGPEGSASKEKIICLRYELTFDETEVLRDWVREPCKLKKKPATQLLG